jgi:uncharacterized membrane protein
MIIDAKRADALLDLTLKPHRSLSPTGFAIVMGLLAFWSFIAGIVFWAVGAWPVIGFIGLDVALVYVAFRMSFARAREAEHLLLTGDALTITRIDTRGRASEVTLQPYWLRVAIEEAPGRAGRLSLTSHGRSTVVGGFLAPEERARVRDRLLAALALARAQPNPSTSRMP